MWDWIVHNSVWILIVASVAVLLLLFFHDRVCGWISRLRKKEQPEIHTRGVHMVYFTVEGIAIAILVLAFVAMITADSGATVTKEMVEQWFVDHGVRIAVIIFVGVALWLIIRRTFPPLVQRFMAKPQKGESREGLNRRANTLQSVFIGLGRIVIVLMVIFMILDELNIPIGPMTIVTIRLTES